jgi:hypothetical protein
MASRSGPLSLDGGASIHRPLRHHVLQMARPTAPMSPLRRFCRNRDTGNSGRPRPPLLQGPPAHQTRGPPAEADERRRRSPCIRRQPCPFREPHLDGCG